MKYAKYPDVESLYVIEDSRTGEVVAEEEFYTHALQHALCLTLEAMNAAGSDNIRDYVYNVATNISNEQGMALFKAMQKNEFTMRISLN